MYRYVGRADSQVKLRGFRLELGEVEAVLASIVGVQDAVAVLQVSSYCFCIMRQMQSWHEQYPLFRSTNTLAFHMQDAHTPTALLVAYVTPETADEAALLTAVHAKLPAYMVPSAIIKLAELPRLASGKVCCPSHSRMSSCSCCTLQVPIFMPLQLDNAALCRSPARRCPAVRVSVPLCLWRPGTVWRRRCTPHGWRRFTCPNQSAC